MKEQRGFSLIEIMVVIVILGLISTVVAVAAVERQEAARRDKALLDIRALMSALELFQVQRGRLPTAVEGLEILERQRFIRELESDPWGTPYSYQVRDGDPVIMSYGADGAPGGTGKDEDVRLPQR